MIRGMSGLQFFQANMAIRFFIAFLIKKGKSVVWIDESSFIGSNTQYSSLGKTSMKPYKYGSIKHVGLYLVAAMAQDRIDGLQISNHAFTATSFKDFLEKALKKYWIKSKSQYSKRVYVFMDNASMHRGPLLKKYYLESGLQVIFNFSNNAIGNLIEDLFFLIKKGKRNSRSWTKYSLMDLIESNLRLITTEFILKLHIRYLEKFEEFENMIVGEKLR